VPTFSGFIRSVSSGVYTFRFSSFRNVERFVLIIDDQRLFDSQISSSSAVSATIALGEATMYSLWIELSSVLTLDKMCLQWSYNTSSFLPIPNLNLFSKSRNISGSPFSLTVHPAAFCASTSRAFGSGISLATSGQPTSFFILLRDSFGNNVSYNQSVHRLAVHLRYRIRVPKFGKSLSRGVVSSFADSIAVASYRTFVVRDEQESSSAFGQWQEMIISRAVGGHLIATYFSVSDGSSKVAATAMKSSAFDYNSAFVAKFSGFFARDAAEWKFLRLTIPANSVLKSSTTVLGLQLLADVASNSTHSSHASFDIDSLEIGSLGDVYFEISGHSGSVMSSLRLDFVSEANSTQIPSDQLFARYDIPVSTTFGSGLLATYYMNTTMQPLTSFTSATLDWTTMSANDRPFGLASTTGFSILRWNGMLTVTRPSMYTFYAVKVREDNISIAINGLSFLEPISQATVASGTILLAEPLTFEILITHAVDPSASSHGFYLSFSCCNDAKVIPVPPSALKRKMAAYNVDYNDKSSFDWPSGMDLRHSTDRMPLARGPGKIYPDTARLLVLPFNEISEGGSFIDTGSLTTSAVVGAYSTFQVHARDYWLNRVASSSQINFVASRLVSSVLDSADGYSNPPFMIP